MFLRAAAGLSALRLLRLCSNPLGDGTLGALLALVRQQPTCGLQELHLQDSALSHDACRAIRRAYDDEAGGLRRLMIFLAPIAPQRRAWP